MGNLNSRETVHILENEEFKHVCRNLGDLFRSHGEYLQHRKERSRKAKHNSEVTKSRRKGESEEGNSSQELRDCRGKAGCPYYKLITDQHKFIAEQFGEISLGTRSPRSRGESRHRRPRDQNQSRYTNSPSSPPQHIRNIPGAYNTYLLGPRNGILCPLSSIPSPV